jgi:CheY-like chemotaxis protein
MADPQDTDSLQDPPAPGPEAPPAAAPAPRRSRPLGRILVVDDDPVNQYVMDLILRAAGYEVLFADTGLAGVETAERERPDIVLMDMVMPEVDGFDGTRLLKASPELRGIPVIMLTAAVYPGDWEQALAAGCDDHLNKPIERSVLLGRLRYWMAVLEARRASGSDGR